LFFVVVVIMAIALCRSSRDGRGLPHKSVDGVGVLGGTGGLFGKVQSFISSIAFGFRAHGHSNGGGGMIGHLLFRQGFAEWHLLL